MKFHNSLNGLLTYLVQIIQSLAFELRKKLRKLGYCLSFHKGTLTTVHEKIKHLISFLLVHLSTVSYYY